jgi:hypothetical protein
MSSLFRSTVFCVLLTACGGLDPAAQMGTLPADPATMVPGDERTDTPSDDAPDDDSSEDDDASEEDDAPPPPPPPEDDGTCTTADGQLGLFDCRGACMPEAFLGDGYCDDGADGGADFACVAYDDDDGDCGSAPGTPAPPAPSTPAPPVPGTPVPPPPATPAPPPPGTPAPPTSTCTTANGAPGIPDCDGVCNPPDFIGDGYCDNGSGEANFQCAAHGNDGGDCGATTPAPAPPPTGPTPAPPAPTPAPPAPAPPAPAPPAIVYCVLPDLSLGVVDCAGYCAPAAWLGDDVCDNGPTGVLADFDCPMLANDGGDCLP